MFVKATTCDKIGSAQSGATNTTLSLTKLPITEAIMAQTILPLANSKTKICSLPGCDSPVKAVKLCNRHWLRRYFHGDVNHTERIVGAGTTHEERFWSRVDQSGGLDACWLWQGPLMNKGYGTVKCNHRRWLAHRFSLYLYLGREPQGLVLHSCDNPPCVNPRHLREGTHADNTRDAIERGRRK